MQSTRYKVVAIAAGPAELSSSCCPKGQPILAIVGIDRQNGNLDEVAESIRLLRSMLPNGKVVLVAETDGRIDLQRVPALSPDACIFKLGSRDALIKVLELTLLDQRVIVFAKSIATPSKEDVQFTDRARGLQSDDPCRLGINGHRLSVRESQVLTCVAQGKSNKEIARFYYRRTKWVVESQARDGAHARRIMTSLFQQAINCEDGRRSSKTRSVLSKPTSSNSFPKTWPADREQRARIIAEWLQLELRLAADKCGGDMAVSERLRTRVPDEHQPSCFALEEERGGS